MIDRKMDGGIGRRSLLSHVSGSLSMLAGCLATLGPARIVMAAPEDQKLSPETTETIRLAVPYFQQELGKMGAVNLALYVLITVGAATLFGWWVSQWFNQNRASFKNALRLSAWFVGFAVFGLVGGMGLFKVGYAIGAVAFVLIMLVVGAFAPPMKVYEFTVTKAAGFLACWIILNALVQLLAGALLTEGKGMPWTRLLAKNPAERPGFLQRELAQDGEGSSAAKSGDKPVAKASSAPPAAPAPVVAPDLRAMYEALQKDRQTLDMNNREAVAAFNVRAAEYKALVSGKTSSTPSSSPSGSPASSPVPAPAGNSGAH